MGGFSDYAMAILLTLFVIGCLWLSFKERSQLALLLLIFGVTFIASIIMATKIPMLPRYLIFLMIPLSLGIGMACTRIPFNIPPKAFLGGFLALFMIMSIPFYSSYYSNYSKDDWKGISKDLTQIAKPGDTIIAVPTYIEMPLGYYYQSFFHGTNMVGAMNVSELETIKQSGYAANGTRYYIITGDISAADPSGQSMQWLQKNTQLVRDYGTVKLTKGI
jgi:hypothetical protein